MIQTTDHEMIHVVWWLGVGGGGVITELLLIEATDCFTSTHSLKTSSISSSVLWISALCEFTQSA